MYPRSLPACSVPVFLVPSVGACLVSVHLIWGAAGYGVWDLGANGLTQY